MRSGVSDCLARGDHFPSIIQLIDARHIIATLNLSNLHIRQLMRPPLVAVFKPQSLLLSINNKKRSLRGVCCNLNRWLVPANKAPHA